MKKSAHGRGHTTPRKASYKHEYKGQIWSVKRTDVKTRQEAEDIFDRRRKEFDARPTSEEKIITVRDLLGEWCEAQEGKGQVETAVPQVKRYLMKSWLADLDANKISVGDAEKWRKERWTKYAEKGPFQTHSKTRPAPDTLNKDITYLNGALALLRPEPRFLKVKPLDKGPNHIRQGFLVDEQYQSLVPVLDPWQKPLWCFAYYTAIRQGELRKLRRDWAKDVLKTQEIFVPAFSIDGQRVIKNGRAHTIPLYMPEMVQYVLWALETGDPKCPYLFQRDGEQIGKDEFYHHYKKAVVKHGIPETLFHDTRRSAVRNMLMAGLTKEEIMEIANMKTDSIFRRYNIILEAEQAMRNHASGVKVRRFWEEARGTDLAKISPNENGPIPPANWGTNSNIN